jgi:hypothetical protein
MSSFPLLNRYKESSKCEEEYYIQSVIFHMKCKNSVINRFETLIFLQAYREISPSQFCMHSVDPIKNKYYDIARLCIQTLLHIKKIYFNSCNNSKNYVIVNKESNVACICVARQRSRKKELHNNRC